MGAATVRVCVKRQLTPLLLVAALFPVLEIHRDKESRDRRERSAPEFSHRLVGERTDG
jgi:hypothetical protein